MKCIRCGRDSQGMTECLECDMNVIKVERALRNPLRNSVIQMVIGQAVSGANWKRICAAPMMQHRISVDEIEVELLRRGIVPAAA